MPDQFAFFCAHTHFLSVNIQFKLLTLQRMQSNDAKRIDSNTLQYVINHDILFLVS